MTDQMAEQTSHDEGDVATGKRTFIDTLFLSPEERRLRAGWRLLLQSLILGVFVLGLQFIVRYYISDNIPGARNYRSYIFRAITLVGITGSVFVARVVIDGRSFQSLGLSLDGKSGRDFAVGLGISFLMAGLTFLAEWSLGWMNFIGYIWNESIPQNFTVFWFIFLALFLTTAWQEELLFRGYWIKNIHDGLNSYWAIGLSAVAFAAAYFLNPNYTVLSLIGLLIIGLFYGYAAVSTRRLWLPLGLHLGWKLFSGNLLGFPVSGLQVPGLIIQQGQGPLVWTGGQMGPEGGLILLPAVLLGAFMVWIYTSSEGKLPQ